MDAHRLVRLGRLVTLEALPLEGTPAKYTDDCGHSIFQYQGKGYAPNNICRGSYTDFCGYFYQNNSTAYVA